MRTSTGDVEKCIFSTWAVWKQYIDSLDVPHDEIDRATNQFKCEVFMRKLLHEDCLLRNIAAIPLLFISVIGTLIFFPICNKYIERQKCDMLLLSNSIKQTPLRKEDIPKELARVYPKIKVLDIKRRAMLVTGKCDKTVFHIFMECVKRNHSAFFFNLIVFTHMTAVCKWIEIYDPKCIVISEGENDFTSSIVKLYCETKDVKYINVMHGENFVNPYHSFVEFSEFYVWDSFYAEQYKKTYSPVSMFKIYNPTRFTKATATRDAPEFFMTYYLQGQNKSEMEKIKNILESFIMNGKRCKIRPHKTATNMKYVKAVFDNSEIIIEEPSCVDICESMSNSEYIVSMYSTVLSEALAYGMLPVIDDITDPVVFKGLKDCMYINISKISKRLSDFIERI